jgi:hypothetical protein
MDLLDLSSIDGSENSIYNTLEDHGREVLILNIDIGNGRSEDLKIREHDTPKLIAQDFCRKHNLNPEAEKVLLDVIKDHLRVKPVVEVSMMVDKSEKKEESLKQSESFRYKQDEVRSKTDKTFNDHSKISRFSNKPNFGERLYNEGLQMKEKHEKKISELREQLDKELMRESTFKPNITPELQMPRIQFLGSEASKPVDRCEALYKKAQKSSSVAHSPNKFVANSPSMSQKILNSRKNLQLYLEQREKSLPKRGKSPNLLTHDRSLKRNQRSQSQERKTKKLSNEQTDKILNRIKTIRFVQLFESLNPNENQEINKFTVIDAKLGSSLHRVLLPFLEELTKIRKGLNLDQFCKVMELYIKELTPEDRSLLLQTGKKKGNSSKGMTQDLGHDLWSPKHEEKLLAFDFFPEYS